MQKVVTITSHTGIISKGEEFKESEYPKLNAYLKEGYVIVQVVPVIKPADASYTYSLTFVLGK
jgi:hypothetical protein